MRGRIWLVAGMAAAFTGAAPEIATATSAPPVGTYATAAAAQVARAEAGVPADERPHDTAGGTSVDTSCFSTAEDHVDPELNAQGKPTNPAWWARDRLNVMCANLRLADQATPSYAYAFSTTGSALWLDNLAQQEQQGVDHLHGGITSEVPGALGTDPFRAVAAWEHDTGGTVDPVSFTASDGAQLNGEVFMPPPGTPTLADGRYPGVVITDGSVQAFQNMYYWAAEGLAQYGYEVMTYDVQGQGDSDLLPSPCTVGDCPGVPYQQNYNFYQGAEDALNFFLSTPAHPDGAVFNPGATRLDQADVGIAGHSLGASAVSWVAQCDKRVKAVVAWDDLLPVTPSQCAANVTVPAADRSSRLHAPALTTVGDYEFEPTLAEGVPDPNASAMSGTSSGVPGASSAAGFIGGGGLDGDAGYEAMKAAGVDSMIVSIRNATHLTYSYIPYVLPANEIGERVAFYYTLAWFDQYLRGGRDALLPAGDTAYRRLTSLTSFDESADHNDNRIDPEAADVSIGAGTYSLAQSKADPASEGNVPYEIQGIPIKGALSFYYYSQYAIHDPAARHDPLKVCLDMLAGCPELQPSTP